jgi:hypothetical protein
MAILHCRRSPDRTAVSWQKALAPFADLERVVSDQGSGLQAGFDLINLGRRTQNQPLLELGLDVFHIEKEAQTILGRIWRQVEKAWKDALAADQRLAKAIAKNQEGQKNGRTVLGLRKRVQKAWGTVERKMNRHQRYSDGWQRAKAALEVFRPDGRLNNRAWAQGEIEAACAVLKPPQWRKVRKMLRDERTLSFVDSLAKKLAEAVPQEELREALVELWRLEHRGKRTAGKVVEAAMQQAICGVWDGEWLKKYEGVKEVLAKVVRASSAVECVNSVLRMQQGQHRNVSQGMLDLKRLYWNSRNFRSGKRRGQCPYQLLGATLPTFDFWQLLQYSPEILSQEVSSQQLAA